MMQMIINAAEIIVGALFPVMQQFKALFGPIVVQKLAKIFTPNLLIRCSTSGKSTK